MNPSGIFCTTSSPEEAGACADLIEHLLVGGLRPGEIGVVVFPNVLEGTVDEVVMLRSSGTDTSYLGMHQVPSGHFARRLEAMAEAALPEPGLAHLRRVFTPESVVPTPFVPRLPADRNTEAPVPPPAFLDFDQEWCVKNDLELLSERHLFLAADPTQGFLRRRQSWIAAGIDVRGRSTRLKRPYRTTQAILRFARDFHLGRGTSDDTGEDLNIPDDAQISSIVEEGLEPSIIHVPTPCC
jgi:hypothetical protein